MANADRQFAIEGLVRYGLTSERAATVVRSLPLRAIEWIAAIEYIAQEQAHRDSVINHPERHPFRLGAKPLAKTLPEEIAERKRKSHEYYLRYKLKKQEERDARLHSVSRTVAEPTPTTSGHQ